MLRAAAIAERAGVPSVSIVTTPFMQQAAVVSKGVGLPSLPIAEYPGVPMTDGSDAVARKVEALLPQLVAGLAGARDTGRPTAAEPGPRDVVHRGTLDEIQELFHKNLWSDGLPVIPPTLARVERFLAHTRRQPDEVIGRLLPENRAATVWSIAVNAVMAGCGPEHLPLLIAAVRCLAEPKMYIRNKAMSTGPHAPLVLVNGPKGRVAGLNSGMCALGPGAPSASNTVLGRAVRLTMMNVGHTYVGVSDMDTIGSPLKYSLCCAENEAESPWEPYHVSRGFARDASTVTVHFVYGICELHDFRSTAPDDLVQVFATAATNVAQVGTGLWLIGRRADPRSKTEEKEHNTLFICPEHAQVFAKAGWGRREIQAALYRAARLPFRTMILNKEPKAMATAHPELAWLADHPDLPVPVVEEPTCFDIAVVGAAAGRGAYFYGAGEPVTMPVED